MQTTVVVNANKISILDAIFWAISEFGRNNVDIKNTFPGNIWYFDFTDEKHASLFALKWYS